MLAFLAIGVYLTRSSVTVKAELENWRIKPAEVKVRRGWVYPRWSVVGAAALSMGEGGEGSNSAECRLSEVGVPRWGNVL